MSIESHELALYAENNGDLYRQRIEPVIKNLRRKISKGIYDPVKALMLWKYVADDAAKRYGKEFGNDDGYGIFSPAVRRETAIELQEYYEEAMREENPSRRSVHTKKFDDCVRDVKRKGDRYNPYAVCMASLGERGAVRAGHRRKNPVVMYIIVARGKGAERGAVRYWTGHDWHAHDRDVQFFARETDALNESRGLTPPSGFAGPFVVEHRLSIRGRETTRRNPVAGFVLIARNNETRQRAYYDGMETFSTNRNEARVYESAARAQAAARMLTQDGKMLKRGWRYAVAPATRKNPIERGARLYEDFHGEPPQSLKTRKIREFSEGLEIGPVVAVTYDTLRDGKITRYEHEFKKSASPLLIASDDGRTLQLTGGCYQFTDRGIVDRAK